MPSLKSTTKFDSAKLVLAILIGLAISIAVGQVAFKRGVAEGYKYGFQDGNWEIKYVMSLPAGGLYMSFETQAIWSGLPNQMVAFTRIPPPHVAQLMKNFEAPDRSKPATTTTTTIPEVKK